MSTRGRPVPQAKGLEAHEDGELRRLAALSEFGAASPTVNARMIELRGRDRRNTVRPPRAEDTSSTTGKK